MASDEERLIVLLEARVRDFERNMQKASGTADRSYGRMRRESRSATAQMEADMQRSTTRINQALAATSTRIGAYGKAFAGGLLGGIAAGGIAGAVGQIRQVARGLAEIGDEARRAGVSAQAFQEWRFVAEQNRIGIDQMVDGLKELNLRADEFVSTGSGPAAEAFQRLGYGADELQRKLKYPSELMLEIIDRLGKMDRAAQIRIADEIFGGSAGERFVELLEQGEDGIRSTIEEARRLGTVIDDEVIERAAELDRRFNAVTTTVSVGLKTAIVEAASAMQAFIDSFRGWWDDYERRRQGAENIRDLGAYVGSLAGKPAAAPQSRTTPKTDRLPEVEWVPPTPPPGGFGSVKSGAGRRATRDAAAVAAKREAERVRELIGDLEHELRLVGATDLQREISNTLRDAGAAATAEQEAQIVSLITALHAEEEATRRASEAAEELRDIGRDVIGGLVDDLQSGTSAADALANALAGIGTRLLNSGLDGLFNSLLGGLGGGLRLPGRAMGGPVTAGQAYIVGERRPEVFVPNTSGRIVPDLTRLPQMPAAADRGNSAPPTITINVDVTGATGNTEVQDMVRAGVSRGIGEWQRSPAFELVVGHAYKRASARGLVR